jgi:hypothetical protein
MRQLRARRIDRIELQRPLVLVDDRSLRVYSQQKQTALGYGLAQDCCSRRVLFGHAHHGHRYGHMERPVRDKDRGRF